ncbi:unnamed protein product [Pleuronectes platessa]|uniref:Uncharacterized protein n=1 Tax=Pleuronectes platessa TaxID=8262 RepID=A0A9N7YHU2_PLEPL|nr:unnamed protein product [Pleuronectes platessa]
MGLGLKKEEEKSKGGKVEFTSPYGKMAAGEGDTETSVFSKEVVTSHARTEMLDRDSSESPGGSAADFSSTKVRVWSEVDSKCAESEERESSSWFKVPKFTLKPHSKGFLRITPEGSPQAMRKGELGGEADVLGSFCLHTSGMDFTTLESSEEHQVSSTESETLTTVTKTTRVTQCLVSTETRTGESSTTVTTTEQEADFKH